MPQGTLRQITVTTEDIMSVQEAAAAIGRPRMTLYRWIQTGLCVSIKLGGVVYVPTSEVERLKREQQISGKQEAPAPRTDAGA